MNENTCEKLKRRFNRYIDDHWYFAALLTSGTVLGFTSLDIVDEEYVELFLFNGLSKYYAFGKTCMESPTTRTTCLVRIDHIVAICEVADT